VANFFAQFDEKKEEEEKPNFFAQFDKPEEPVEELVTEEPTAVAKPTPTKEERFMPEEEAGEVKTRNPLMGLFGRTVGLGGAGAGSFDTFAQLMSNVTGLPKEEIFEEGFGLAEVTKIGKDAEEALTQIEKDIGYAPTTQLKDLAENPLNAVPFILERVITSVPDMAAAYAAAPAYVVARTNEILQERVKNDDKTMAEATVGDVAAAVSAAAFETTFEKFATGRLLKKAGAPGKTAVGRIGKETGLQSATEFAEEVGAYAGETAGTKRGFDFEEAALAGLEGAIVGGGLGAGVQTGKEITGTATKPKDPKLADAIDKLKQDALKRQEEEDMGEVVDTEKDVYEQLKAKAQGTEARTITTPTGETVTIPAVQPELLTKDEQQEYQRLRNKFEPETEVEDAEFNRLREMSPEEFNYVNQVLTDRLGRTPTAQELEKVVDEYEYSGSKTIDSILGIDRGAGEPGAEGVITEAPEVTPGAEPPGVGGLGGVETVTGQPELREEPVGGALEPEAQVTIDEQLQKEDQSEQQAIDSMLRQRKLTDADLITASEEVQKNFGVSKPLADNYLKALQREFTELARMPFIKEAEGPENFPEYRQAKAEADKLRKRVEAVGKRKDTLAKNETVADVMPGLVSEEETQLKTAEKMMADIAKQPLNVDGVEPIGNVRNFKGFKIYKVQSGSETYWRAQSAENQALNRIGEGDSYHSSLGLAKDEIDGYQLPGKYDAETFARRLLPKLTEKKADVVDLTEKIETKEDAELEAGILEDEQVRGRNYLIDNPKVLQVLEEASALADQVINAGEVRGTPQFFLSDVEEAEQLKSLIGSLTKGLEEGTLSNSEKQIEDVRRSAESFLTDVGQRAEANKKSEEERMKERVKPAEEMTDADFLSDMMEQEEVQRKRAEEGLTVVKGGRKPRRKPPVAMIAGSDGQKTIAQIKAERRATIRADKNAITRAIKRYEKELAKQDPLLAGMLEYQAELKEEGEMLKEDAPTTPEAFLARATTALRDGEISREVYDIIYKLFTKNPKLLDGIKLGIRQQPETGQYTQSAGSYIALRKLINLYKGTQGVQDPDVVVHEITHSMEQMMSYDAKDALAKVWADKLIAKLLRAKSDKERTFFNLVFEMHTAPTQEEADAAYKAAIDMLGGKDGIGFDFYQYVTPSEYWAVNATPLMKASLGTGWDKFKAAMRGIFEVIKDTFGFDNNREIHRLFKDVMRGDKKRMSESLINDFIFSGLKKSTTPVAAPQIPTTPSGFRTAPTTKDRTTLESVKDKFTSFADIFKLGSPQRKALFSMYTLRMLAETVGNRLPQFRGAINISDKMVSMRNNIMREGEKGIDKLLKIISLHGQEQVDALGTVAIESTIRGIDPSVDRSDLFLTAAWDSLHPDTQEAYKIIRDFYATQIDGLISDLKDVATANIQDETARAKAIARIDQEFREAKKVKPYFPLRRFGNYWFQVGKGKNKEFYVFESERERNKWLEVRKKELADAGALDSTFLDTGNEFLKDSVFKTDPDFKLLQDLEATIDSVTESAVDKDAMSAELKDAVKQLAYMLMPQNNFRKMFINRRGIQGASTDITRIFSNSVINMAYQRARVRYTADYRNNINRAVDQHNRLPQGKNKEVLGELLAELKDRTPHVLGTEPTTGWHKLANNVTQAAFLYLLTAPASAFVNIFGAAAVGMPTLGGRYGYFKSNAALLKYTAKYLGTTPAQVLGKFEFPTLESEEASLSPLMRKAFKRLLDDNLINASQTHDIMGLGDKPIELYSSRWNKFTRIISAIFHNSERLNREGLAMATFELAHEKAIKDGKNADDAFEFAIQEAKDITSRGLGDFTRASKPPVLTNPAAKVVFQFKQYSLLMTYNMLKDMRTMMNIAAESDRKAQYDLLVSEQNTPEQIEQKMAEFDREANLFRKEAFKRFSGTMVVTFAFAGTAGLPFASAVGLMIEFMSMGLAFATGDEEDEIKDAQAWARNYMDDVIGGRVTNAILRGPLAEVSNVALSERMSLDFGDLWLRESMNAKTAEQEFLDQVANLLGPAFSLARSGFKAYDLLNEYKPERAAEAISPSILRNLLMTARYVREEGVRTRTGDMIDEDLSYSDLFARSLGFTPEDVMVKQKTLIKRKAMEQDIDLERQRLLGKLFMEILFRDSDGRRETMEMIREYNKRSPKPIDDKTIMQSMETRYKQKAVREYLGGINDPELEREISKDFPLPED
jgi:hypothetical protein